MLSEIHSKIIAELSFKNYTLSEITEITGCSEDVIFDVAKQQDLKILNDITSENFPLN